VALLEAANLLFGGGWHLRRLWAGEMGRRLEHVLPPWNLPFPPENDS
jgi:hypothetical protein